MCAGFQFCPVLEAMRSVTTNKLQTRSFSRADSAFVWLLSTSPLLRTVSATSQRAGVPIHVA